MIADVAGYTRMMERDDVGTLERVRMIRADVTDAAIAASDGRVVKTAGDGFLAEFPSAVAALQAGITIQREMSARNFGLGADERIDYRIGINVGDILVDGQDIAGDGVNIASRLESLAEPGGICVSAAVREQVHRDLGAGFIDLGDQQVKNHERPVRVFRVAIGEASRAATVAAQRVAHSRRVRWTAGVVAFTLIAVVAIGIAVWRLGGPGSAPPPLSAAVLPFAAVGGDSDVDSLAQALTSDVTMGLERTAHSYRIASPAAAAAFQDRPLDLAAAARALDVRYVARGEVRRSTEHLIVSLQLSDALQGRQVWSDRIEVEAAKAPQTSVQRGLSGQLVYKLRSAIFDAEIARVRKEPANRGSALEAIVRADGVWSENPDNVKGALAARKLYDEAIKLDPRLVPALTGRALTLDVELSFDPASDRERLLPAIEEATSRAFALDPEDALVWRMRAKTLAWQFRWDAALEAFRHAERLEPARISTFMDHAYTLMWMGRPEDAIGVNEHALANDVLHVSEGPIFRLRCRCNIMLGRLDEAIADCEKALAAEDLWPVHLYLMSAYALKADDARAAAEKVTLLKQWPGANVAAFIAHGRKFSNAPEFWEKSERTVVAGLRKAGLPER
jgi:class 3 adenylate cyclase/TolB-like protein